MIRLPLLVALACGLQTCLSAQCPTTNPPNPPFVPPAPYRANVDPSSGFLYGRASLWTWISTDPEWRRGPECCRAQRPYVAKLAYLRPGFDARKESDPELTVVVRRLDVLMPLVWAVHAHATWGTDDDNRIHVDSLTSMAMLTVIELPTAGCWEIVAHYKDQTLS